MAHRNTKQIAIVLDIGPGAVADAVVTKLAVHAVRDLKMADVKVVGVRVEECICLDCTGGD